MSRKTIARHCGADPSLARARLGLAEELRKAHRTAEAAAEYDAYLALEPGDAAAHLGAGQNLMELGDEAAAARHLHRADRAGRQKRRGLQGAGRRGRSPRRMGVGPGAPRSCNRP